MKKLLATMLALVMALTLCATAWAEGETTATVTDWAGLQAALAEGKTTIDLSNGTYSFAAVEGESIAINGKTVTFQNGTFDVSRTTISAKNSFFDITSSNVTFNNVKFTGNDYWSGYAVIYGYQKSTVVLNGCTFELTGENHKDGGILKGEKLDGSDSNFNVTNCTFNLTNTVRVFANTTLTMTNSTVNSVINKDVDNAFRNLYGTITNSTITVSGHEHGLKNDQKNVLKLVNSTVTLSNSTVKDLLLDNGATVELDINSVLTYSTVNEATVTLTLVLDEGKKTMIPLVKDGSVDLTKYVPTKTGYTFGTWVNTNDGKTYSGKIDLSDDLTLSATWNNNVYNINYELDGGTNADTNPATYTYGEGVTSFANPTKTGFTFKGWKNGDTVVTSISDTATGDITLTATWQRNQNRNPSSTTTTTTTTTVTKAESPKTFDAGIAVYGVMTISSVLGMGYMGKKKV